MLDGTYFQKWCLLIAFDGTFVVDWQWCDHEKKIAWQQICQRQPAPAVAVIDGGRGLETALADSWPDTRIQRCYFHIFQTVRRHHTLNPRLDAGREILALTRALMNVRDPDQAVMWLQAYNDWEQRWDQFLRHRTYARTHTVRPRGIASTSTWWYTHRGMPAEHARRAAEWLLNSLTRQPRTPIDLARPEHWNPPPSRPDRTSLEHEQIGPQFGASFSWEDGNGIQHGWGGSESPRRVRRLSQTVDASS